MDEVTIDGATYYRSTHAADKCEYTNDWLSRLACEGVIDGRKLGNVWYIKRESLMAYT